MPAFPKDHQHEYMSTTTDKIVWWALSTVVTIAGALSLMILDSIREQVHDLNARQQLLIARVSVIEALVAERNTYRGISPQNAH
jgi:hypothetical protein